MSSSSASPTPATSEGNIYLEKEPIESFLQRHGLERILPQFKAQAADTVLYLKYLKTIDKRKLGITNEEFDQVVAAIAKDAKNVPEGHEVFFFLEETGLEKTIPVVVEREGVKRLIDLRDLCGNTKWVESLDLGAFLKARLVHEVFNAIEPESSDRTTKNILDPVHGLMKLDLHLFPVIDSRAFQRLRELRQLGACRYVFPGANHTRFEHSLGVSYLARELFDNLCRKLRISSNDPECRLYRRAVSFAGLMHDLGHGPFSHTFEYAFVNSLKPDAGWEHETMSMGLVDLVFDTAEGIPDADRQELPRMIKNMIRGVEPQGDNPRTYEDPGENLKRVADDIVANKRNGVDVDKFDYLQRDAITAGPPGAFPRFDCSRVMNYCRPINGEICYNEKEAYQLWTMFHNRYVLFKQLYCHRKVRGIEFMICDALKRVEPWVKILDSLDDPALYVNLDDTILSIVQNHGRRHKIIDPDEQKAFKDAQEILKRIENRNLYKFCMETYSPVPTEDPRKTDNEGIKFYKDQQKRKAGEIALEIAKYIPGLHEDDIIVDFNKIHYGMKTLNPFDNLHFYRGATDSADTVRTFNLDRARAGLFATQYQEVQMRFFVREHEKLDAAQKAIKKFFETHGRVNDVEEEKAMTAYKKRAPNDDTMPCRLSQGAGQIPLSRHTSHAPFGNAAIGSPPPPAAKRARREEVQRAEEGEGMSDTEKAEEDEDERSEPEESFSPSRDGQRGAAAAGAGGGGGGRGGRRGGGRGGVPPRSRPPRVS
uniref:HD/PDEase domain-containing protein n=1 Tax=Chromera velia CCMP2878 TaxID=1169474 RepID=A0A0G4I091_9ALVE|eukprot:Cvel_9873.t1-p1 / transcript=Cvel_9873.t1 / gene=Cvel_9873 / organism=Chromera_velia_CCMP2878 / gene_product=Deoxynucleoside triphosphate triphosphohydrolase, putative / transcript_product=Deoxynucleoside triphosphate triphosphohydrolase, putative / location=Cvel_scaffold582:21427-34079(+) / protein_length=764 / sequence_SO=supercontig / SO=protein_coding / is_pseudo=false